MKNLNINSTVRSAVSAIVLGAILLPTGVLADSHNGHSNSKMHQGGHMSNQGHMSGQGHMMNQGMREVMGSGRINKVMADRHMVNIVHEPIAEMEWPKMRMNFKTADGVNLDDLKPGQEVIFKLQVNKDNSYVIKQIDVK